MSRPFSGFSTQRDRSIALPAELFTDVLAEVQDLAELKVLLTIFRLAAAQRDLPRDRPRAVGWETLRQDEVLREGLAVLGKEQTVEERLDRALERAVARGTVLHLVAQRSGHAESWYILNTAANRRLVQALGQDLGRLSGTPLAEASAVSLEPPSIFSLYEQNIGLVTPMLAEELAEAAEQYPPEWIEEAFREAVTHNRRHWRYIQAILERWARDGRGGRPGRGTETFDMDKYTRGKYAYLFRRRTEPHEEGADESD
jgi:DNA replication protein